LLALDIEWKGFWGAGHRFARGTERLVSEQRSVVRQAAHLFEQNARALAPQGKYYDREGNPTEPDHERLYKSIRTQPAKTLPTRAGGIGGTQISVEMAPHGKFTLAPTKPHAIFGRKGALAFFWAGAPPDVQAWARGPIMGHGHWVVLPGVIHPGYTPPSPNWAEQAWQPVGAAMWQELKRVGHEWVSSVTLGGA